MRHHPHGDSTFNLNLKLIPVVDQPKVITVQVCDSYRLQAVKERITTEHRIPLAAQRILFAGRMLDDERTVESYKVREEKRTHGVEWLS